MKIITAEYVLPISSPPITNGAVAIENSSIVLVGRKDKLQNEHPDAEIIDHGRSALMPGLVNCHTHFELTAMRGYLDDVEDDFGAWLLKLTKRRYEMSDEEIFDSALLGAKEAAAAGVTCVGDVGRNASQCINAINEVGLRAVVYQETKFSPDDETCDADLAELLDIYERLRSRSSELIEVGISPHSPYTVGAKLLTAIAKYAVENSVKLTIHNAESAAESELLQNGTGFFADLHKKFGVNWRSPRVSSTAYLKSLGVLDAKPLLAHCVTISEDDVALISDHGCAVAHCPCSNAKFGHGVAPLAKFISAGVNVGLGSDSVASNNMCDILAEARFASFLARNNGETIRAEKMLEIATMGGAKALGLADKVGSLEAGKQADLAVISLDRPGYGEVFDINSAVVFAANCRDVAATYVAGKCIYTL